MFGHLKIMPMKFSNELKPTYPLQFQSEEVRGIYKDIVIRLNPRNVAHHFEEDKWLDWMLNFLDNHFNHETFWEWKPYMNNLISEEYDHLAWKHFQKVKLKTPTICNVIKKNRDYAWSYHTIIVKPWISEKTLTKIMVPEMTNSMKKPYSNSIFSEITETYLLKRKINYDLPTVYFKYSCKAFWVLKYKVFSWFKSYITYNYRIKSS